MTLEPDATTLQETLNASFREKGIKLENAWLIISGCNNETFGPGIYIDDLYVKRAFRRRGYGTMMLQTLCDLADELETPIYLHAITAAMSIEDLYAFYEHFGFEKNPGFGSQGMIRTPDQE